MSNSESSISAAEIWKRTLIDNSQGAVFLIDELGVVLEFNSDAADLFGVTKQAIIGRPIEDYIFSRSTIEETCKPPTWRNRPNAASSPKVSLILDGKRADGSEFPLELRITEVALQPRPVYLGHFRDCSLACNTDTSHDRSAVSQPLGKSQPDGEEAWCRSVTESPLLMVWKSNAKGVVEWSNQAWTKFTGIPLEQQVNHQWQTCIHPDDLNSLIPTDGKTNADLPAHASEFRLLNHDHSFHRVFGHVEPVRNHEAAITAYHGACFEIMAPAKAPDEPPVAAEHQIEFDHQTIRDLFDNDRDSLSEIAKLFENTCEESISFLEVAFKQPDQQMLFNTAHRLKGAVANMKAPQVLQLCQQLETAIQDADIVGAEKLSQDVTRQISRLRAAVREQFLS